MYYSAGTYESFAHPEKPKDVDKKSASPVLPQPFIWFVTVR